MNLRAFVLVFALAAAPVQGEDAPPTPPPMVVQPAAPSAPSAPAQSVDATPAPPPTPAPAQEEDSSVRRPPVFRLFPYASRTERLLDRGSIGVQGRIDVSATPVEQFETSLGASFIHSSTGGLKAALDATLRWIPRGWAPDDGISARLMPLDHNRVALGFDPSLQLGRAMPRGKVPTALEVALHRGRFSAWLAVKSDVILNDLIQEDDRLFAPFGGAALRLQRWELEAQAAYVPLGLIPSLATLGVRADTWTAGGAARLTYRTAGPIGSPADLERLRMAPWPYEHLFDAPPPEVTGIEVSLEGVWSTQSLLNPNQFAGTKLQPAWGAQVRAKGSLGRARAQLGGRIASASLTQVDSAGFPPYSAFPSGTEQVPAIWGELSGDYQMSKVPLRPGLLVRVIRPAAFLYSTVLGGNIPPAGLSDHWLVLRGQNLVSVLPTNAMPWPIWSASATLRWDPLRTLSVFADLTWVWDPNYTTFADDLSGVAEPSFESPNRVRGDVVLQLAM